MASIRINTDSLKDKKDWKRHKINDGDNVFRILPPFGENSNGYPYHRWVVAWLADPSTGRRRPYASPYSFGEKNCPVSEYSKLLEKKRDAVAAEVVTKLKEKGLSDDRIKEKVQEKTSAFNEVLYNIKPKVVFIYNACNKSGELGLLELKKTAHDAMKKQMMQYVKDYNQDPTSLNSDPEDSGVWFVVKRTGKNRDTEYSVDKRQVKVRDQQTGKVSWVDDQEALPDNIVENYEDNGYDLTSIYKQVSYDDLKTALLINLDPLFKENPDLMVPGFEIEQEAVEQEVEEEEEDIPPPPPKAAAKPAPVKKITTKFEVEDEEDDEDVPPPPVKAAVKKSTRSAESDAIFDYAERILEG
jgi:hypothetical protein